MAHWLIRDVNGAKSLLRDGEPVEGVLSVRFDADAVGVSRLTLVYIGEDVEIEVTDPELV